jgi:hypothetical protein
MRLYKCQGGPLKSTTDSSGALADTSVFQGQNTGRGQPSLVGSEHNLNLTILKPRPVLPTPYKMSEEVGYVIA